MNEHTPGPWTVADDLSFHGSSRGVVAPAPSGKRYLIAEVNSVGDRGWEAGGADGANARLIAAAPAMLDVVARLVRWGRGMPAEMAMAAEDALEQATGSRHAW